MTRGISSRPSNWHEGRKEQSDSADAQADAETDHIVEEFFVADTDISKYVRPVLAQMMYPNNHLSSLSRPPLPVPLSRHVYALPSRLRSPVTFTLSHFCYSILAPGTSCRSLMRWKRMWCQNGMW